MTSNASDPTKTRSTSLRTHLLLATLLILLGVGNYVVGQARYASVLEAQTRYPRINEMAFEEELFPLPLSPDLNKKSKRLRHRQHRLQFYDFIQQAGMLLVLIGNVYLLIVVMGRRFWQRKVEGSDKHFF